MVERDTIMNNWKDFIKAGKAIFTLENEETGNRFTYQVNKHREKDLWFVKVLIGPNNTSDYQYIGAIFDKEFRLTRKSRVTRSAQSYQVFSWLNLMLNENKDLPDDIRIYHEGRCGICGRTLTVPESIECGFGPVCIVQPNNHIPLEVAKQIQKLFKVKHELDNCDNL